MDNKKNSCKSKIKNSCNWQNCHAQGEYRAPKSPEKLNDYFWFCLEHVREYNANWDYFDGMSEEAILSFQKNATHGHRPTWKAGIDDDSRCRQKTINIESALQDLLNEHITPAPPALPKKEQKYLSLLKLSYPTTRIEIKQQYKILVKQYHPDLNQGDPQSEEQFKIISEAYRFLCNSDYFKA